MAKMKHVSIVVLIALISALCLPGQAEGYYDDMHYHFTYYMARSVGYTPEQAFRIASADVAVDWDEQTEPVQQSGQVKMWLAAGDSYGRDISGKNWESIRMRYVSPVSIPRIRFHAMMDCLNWPLCHFDPSHKARALAVIPVFREQLWQSALVSGNFGAFLHFLEDEPPHAGYPSDNGHWMGVDMWWNNDLLQMGSATDYIDYNGNDGKRNRRGILSKEQQCKSGFLATGDMINEVLKRMIDFANLRIPKQQLRSPNPIFSKSVINNVYWELRKANPVTNAPGFQESTGRAFDNNVALLGMPPLMMAGSFVE